MTESLLRLEAVQASYGQSRILFDVSLTVGPGEMVGLLGRNGMGKTTTVRAVTGQLPTLGGDIIFKGRSIRSTPSHLLGRMGIGLVPEGRRIFPNLTVRENLVAAAANRSGRPDPWTLERVLALFPRLGERLGNWGSQLSGGEQQMLAVGRALMINPDLLILDEATEGLAPIVRDVIWSALRQLKSEGLSILVIDRNLRQMMEVGDRHHIIEKGRTVWSGPSQAFLSEPSLKGRYLSV
ncbi:ABC transporter ATP-binding protein [Bosea vaviloviae]|uniref:ABC transporter ATP-binding protein n=1 Tax=Bosea vaviloviae TaxID=1526658 RepID=A0A1D7UC31_9HYPH|nr:ABC transporter ATP-binding protein [Bosea vaviloviae]AOO84932.1 ABC transporter ATP-binding protein [Bosea vaviloviae]